MEKRRRQGAAAKTTVEMIARGASHGWSASQPARTLPQVLATFFGSRSKLFQVNYFVLTPIKEMSEAPKEADAAGTATWAADGR